MLTLRFTLSFLSPETGDCINQSRSKIQMEIQHAARLGTLIASEQSKRVAQTKRTLKNETVTRRKKIRVDVNWTV